MPNITIPNQSLSSSLTFTEFNQLLEATRDGTRSISAEFLYATSGTAAAPGLTFTSDPDTGLYRSAANTLGIAAGGMAVLLATTDGITMQNDDVRGIRVATFNQLLSASTIATSYTIDWTQAAKQRLMVRNNVTLSFTAPPGVGRFDLRLVQDSVGSRAITWPSTISWATNTAPTLTTTAFRTDIITFDYDGTRYAAVGSLNFTGL